MRRATLPAKLWFMRQKFYLATKTAGAVNLQLHLANPATAVRLVLRTPNIMSDWHTELSEVIEPAVTRSKAIKTVLMGRGVIADTGALLKRNFTGRRAVIFSDRNCYRVCGAALEASLRQADIAASTFIIDEHMQLSASVETAEQVSAELARQKAIPLALGSGVVNDLLKYASLHNDCHFCAVATAASMDGYAAEVTPLTKQGFKTARPGRAPQIVVADLDIIAAAPAKLAGYGYGDIAGKIPAGGDWLIADSLGIDPIDDAAYPLVQDNLWRWLAEPELLNRGDIDATGRLFSGLIVAGLAMELYGSSRPASGAEHNIAHCWEMEGLTCANEKVAHGACVAIGTIAILNLYSWLLRQDLTKLDCDQIVADAPCLDDHFAQIELSFSHPEIVAQAKQEITNKHPTPKQLRERLSLLQQVWPELQGKLSARLPSSMEVTAMLRAAGAPAAPSDICVNHTEYVRTVLRSRYLRDRYTILDLLADIGVLEQAVDAVF